MNIIKMESKQLRVVGIKKRTSAKMFKDIRVGDKLIFSTEVNSVGRGYRGRSYACGIHIENISNGDSTTKTYNQTGFIYDCFEFEEVE